MRTLQSIKKGVALLDERRSALRAGGPAGGMLGDDGLDGYEGGGIDEEDLSQAVRP